MFWLVIKFAVGLSSHVKRTVVFNIASLLIRTIVLNCGTQVPLGVLMTLLVILKINFNA